MRVLIEFEFEFEYVYVVQYKGQDVKRPKEVHSSSTMEGSIFLVIIFEMGSCTMAGRFAAS